MARSIEARLFARYRVNPETGCWEWTGGKQGRKYGAIHYRGKMWRVHRLAAVLWLGFNDDPRIKVCHTCDNPPCFNPAHLFTGTSQDNSDDMVRKGRHLVESSRYQRKLSPSDILAIRQSSESLRSLARRYNVSHETIRKARR